MSPASYVDVLIAGAGPSGVFLAIDLLRRHDITVRIIDKSTVHFPGGRGAGIQPRTLETFRSIGMLDSILALATSIPQMRIYSESDGEVSISTQDFAKAEKPTPSVPYPNPVVLGQATVQRLLRQKLGEYGVEVELGTELTTFEQDDDGVTATLVNGDAQETVRAKFLIGADGARSTVRKTLGFAFIGESKPTQRSVLGDVKAKGVSRNYWHVWGPADRSAAVHLTPSASTDYFQFLAIGSVPGLEQVEPNLESMQKFFTAVSKTDFVLSDPIWMAVFSPNIRMTERFQKGRVFLVGDAGHVHPPAGGQGMNTGVADSYNLGWKLDLVLKGKAPFSLLDSYGVERIPIVAHLLGLTSHLYQQIVNSSGMTPFKRPMELRMLGVNVRFSPIVLDETGRSKEGSDDVGVYNALESGRKLQAGDRAPDGPLKTVDSVSLRLFDLFARAQHTILAFNAGEETIDELAGWERPGLVQYFIISSSLSEGGKRLVDEEGHALNAYGAEDGEVIYFVIRPDGVVGASTHDVKGIKRYFDRVLAA